MLRHLIVVGANPAGLSLAHRAQRAGVPDVLVLEPGERAIPGDAPGRYGLSVRYQAKPLRVEEHDGGDLIVETASETFLTRLCVDATPLDTDSPPPTFPVAATLKEKVHLTAGRLDPRDQDVLVVGNGERAAADAISLQEGGARVVLCFTGPEGDLSELARRRLAEMERSRLATILWRSLPASIEDVGGYPMVFFTDRRTPDLQFDHVVVAMTPDGAPADTVSARHLRMGTGGLHPGRAWRLLVEQRAELLPPLLLPTADPPVRALPQIEALREEYYNATITYFDHSHEDLWVLRIRPDDQDVSHAAGQYATLGLGYWEPRVDDVDEGLTEARRQRLIRRSYSISSRIFDEHGYLVDPAREEEIELYVVHVRPNGERIPALTPRLADKRAGDRVYLGPKIAGRYTLDPVIDPSTDVIFMATGTGEAPHNAMITELLRKGHTGAILSVVTVRRLADLAYERAHRRLEQRFPNYRYLVMPTREPGYEKRYIQDLVRSGELEELMPAGLDPARTHVFLCGNPAMIGLPEWTDDGPVFPESEGVAGLLHQRGFRLDHRGVIGNVHYEEYW